MDWLRSHWQVGLQLYMRYREGTWVERASLAMKPFSLELWLAWMTMLVGERVYHRRPRLLALHSNSSKLASCTRCSSMRVDGGCPPSHLVHVICSWRPPRNTTPQHTDASVHIHVCVHIRAHALRALSVQVARSHLSGWKMLHFEKV